ncbi:MAG: hypothetical protein HY548_06390 [Elusimicrobia bacterium]|nr:hypothetical protein [Elusimicrobiota bacterium]
MFQLRLLSFSFVLLFVSSLFAAEDILRLQVAWNNPFNPSRTEETRFEYSVRGQDRPIRLLVFTIDGRLVRELANHVAQSDALYTQPWDGLNEEGRLVDSGLYFVVLDAGRGQKKVRRVAVRRE